MKIHPLLLPQPSSPTLPVVALSDAQLLVQYQDIWRLPHEMQGEAYVAYQNRVRDVRTKEIELEIAKLNSSKLVCKFLLLFFRCSPLNSHINSLYYLLLVFSFSLNNFFSNLDTCLLSWSHPIRSLPLGLSTTRSPILLSSKSSTCSNSDIAMNLSGEEDCNCDGVELQDMKKTKVFLYCFCKVSSYRSLLLSVSCSILSFCSFFLLLSAPRFFLPSRFRSLIPFSTCCFYISIFLYLSIYIVICK